MKLTYLGHSSFIVETGGHRLLFDPFITPNPLAAGKIDIASLNPHAILISHGHADHIADAVEIARTSGALVISNWEIVQWFSAQGITNTHPMNLGGMREFFFGEVHVTNAIHSSSFPDGTYAGNPCGFVVTSPEGSFYYSGDTALTLDMRLLAESHSLRFAVMPVGDNFTMGPAQAVRAAEFCGVNEVVGVHHSTFPPIEIDKAAAINLFAEEGKVLFLPEIGETLDWAGE